MIARGVIHRISAAARRACARCIAMGSARTAVGPEKAVVKSLPRAPNLQILLTLQGKQRNLDRPKDELLEKPLQRIQKSAAPQVPRAKQPRRKADAGAQQQQQQQPQQPEAPELLVVLHEGPTPDTPPLDPAATRNEEAWQQGRLLRVGHQCYWVERNPPMADRVEVPGAPFVGVPLCPLLTAHFADPAACWWRWLAQPAGGGDWQPIPGAESKLYAPREEDAGCLLRVECTPARRDGPAGSDEAGAATEGELILGEMVAATCIAPVRPLPSPLGAEARLALTKERAQAPNFRVVTYNILADQYATTEVAQTVLFKHVQPEFIAPEYRRPLVVTELLGFQGDVVCLQEVDEKMFSQYLEPQLEEAGYQGLYTNKAGKVREGCAVFWRTDRFTLVAKRELPLKEFFPRVAGAPSKYGHVFDPMLRTSQLLPKTLQKVLSIAQLVLLAPRGGAAAGRPLCVANTHLFFHYMAPHVRTMHTWVIMQEAHELMQAAAADPQLGTQLHGQEPSLLFCGDLNSSLNKGMPGVIELLRSSRLGADYWDWLFGVGFKWEKGEDDDDVPTGDPAPPGGEYGEVSKMVHSSLEHAEPSSSNLGEEVIPGVDLELPFRLRAADDLKTPFTNYVPGYKGLLDYIWYCPEAVEVVREVPLPSQEEIERRLGGPLPSRHFPSDHLPVIFDLRFK